ncbi:MAG: adenosylcobinamide-phosphate synthase CbiB [Pseudomonadota bacterium]
MGAAIAVDLASNAPHLAAMENSLTFFMLSEPAFGATLATIIVAALLLDALFGDFPLLFKLLPHPVVMIGNLIAALEKRLNKPEKSNRERFWRGVVLVVLVLLAAAMAGLAVKIMSHLGAIGVLLEILLVAVLVAQRGLYDHVMAVAIGLRDGGIAGGRRAVSMIVGRDPRSLDQAGVARAAIESCSENFSDGVVAPLFWYVVLGPVGICLYKAINTMDSMIGHRNARYLYFGRCAARLDDVANLIPARLAGWLICLASALRGGVAAGKGAWRMMWRDAGKHKSPNAGWQEAAMAGALGLSLAGPRYYGDELVNDPYIGDGRSAATHSDIFRCLRIYRVACVLNGAWAVALGIILMIWG